MSVSCNLILLNSVKEVGSIFSGSAIPGISQCALQDSENQQLLEQGTFILGSVTS